MKKCFLFFLLISRFCITCKGQVDTIPAHRLSANVAYGILFKEAGLYYNYQYKPNRVFELSYGHRFHNVTIIENGGPGGDFIFWKQTADIVRIGIKTFAKAQEKFKNSSPYLYCRLSFWNEHTPKFTMAYGSNGTSGTPRDVLSVDKNVVNVGLGFGKTALLDEHFYTDLFLVFGISAGQKKIHKYTYGGNDGISFSYPENTFIRSTTLFPTIEIGVNIGLYWK
jgi:hypothetical protein